MSSLQVKLVSRKQQDGKEVWEGTAYVPGFKPTKITRTSDESTTFESRTAVATAARSRAKKLGFEGVDFESKDTKTSVVAAAAKVSTKKKIASKNTIAATSPAENNNTTVQS